MHVLRAGQQGISLVKHSHIQVLCVLTNRGLIQHIWAAECKNIVYNIKVILSSNHILQ